MDEIEAPPNPQTEDRTRRGRTIVIRCWPEPRPGHRPLLRGTIRDLSRSGHIAFEGVAALTTLVRYLLADLNGEAAIGHEPPS